MHARCVSGVSTHVQYVGVCLALVGVLELCVSDEDGVHVGAGVLVELAVAGDHDDRYLTVAEYAQLVGLLEEASFTLAEGDLGREGGREGEEGREEGRRKAGGCEIGREKERKRGW